MLASGLYEQVISKQLNTELSTAVDKLCQTLPIDAAEAAHVLADYVANVIEKGLDSIKDKGGNLQAQVALTNLIISTIEAHTNEVAFDALQVDRRAEQLLAIIDKQNSRFALNEKARVIRPETSVAQSSLFTGAMHEPQMYTELKKEIVSCNRIDMLISFIKWSGLRLIMNELASFTQNGGELRIITTSYMGATDVKAVEELRKLSNTQIKISYDTKRTRLHAKAYVFYRRTGFTTAYIGSSNLSNAAMSSGLEWNVKVTQQDLPSTIQKISASFESYWNCNDFTYYTQNQQERLARALKAEKYFEQNPNAAYAFDISPYTYQQEILDKLQAERAVHGFFRNLVVAATGTGKTVISAFDYKRFCKQNPSNPCRLLFVAHREEILMQSLYTFRGVLKDPNFGELFVGNHKPESIDHLFMSIQTFNSQGFSTKTDAHFYDYIVIDEFHHAAAPTYQMLLSYYEPRILLGLTATPERMDGKSILVYFHNRIAAEIRLPEAIDRKLLSPFQYFGVTDIVDLSSLKWSRGGYDKAELSNIYSFNNVIANRRAQLIVASVLKYITDIEEVKGLGFCVSVAHANFMANHFNAQHISAMCLTAESSDAERACAKQRLISGEVRFLFVVDLYNEGVDIPEVNTVLFLRPTESLTVFLQQLGRGLRLAENKDCLTVLDFIGQANKNYRFEEKFVALLSNTSHGIAHEMKEGFASAPKGCYIQLEKIAQSYILKNIQASLGNTAGLCSRIADFEADSGKPLSLAAFVAYYRMDLRSIYARGSFARLCVLAGVQEDFTEPLETIMTKALLRFCSVDSRRWIGFLLECFTTMKADFSAVELQMLQMLQFTVWQKPMEECGFTNLDQCIQSIKSCPILCAELVSLLRFKLQQIDFIDESVDLGFACPLDLYCSYSRDQILVALDFLKPATVREGVKWFPEKKLDVLFVTLNKSDKDYSPTTLYNDYSINEWLFHWQSQSTTQENSATGQRYIHHREQGSTILLFVREYKTDRIGLGAQSYTFLGKASYVSHEGNRPMNITWRLDRPIPAKFIQKTNKLMVG
ncbi:MAG: DUF3427 domain-containing protein [Clostridia bacterium]